MANRNQTNLKFSLIQQMFSPPDNGTKLATFMETWSGAWQRWIIGLLVITITAFGPSFCITIIPFLNRTAYAHFMTFLVALGVGTLSGSTLYILLPGAFGLDVVDESHYIIEASILLSALYIFFTVDRILAYIVHIRKMRSAGQKIHQSTLNKILENDKNAHNATTIDNNLTLPRIVMISKSSDDDDENDNQKFYELDKNRLKNELEVAMISNALTRKFSSRRQSAILTLLDDEKLTVEDNYPRRKIGMMSMNRLWNNVRSKEKVSKEVSTTTKCDQISVNVEVIEEKILDSPMLDVGTVAWMIIFGSSANNFMDGMSNGAAFADSFSRGLSLGIAIIAQQLPQEIGTLAILIQSGLGLKKALLLNLLPNSLSYLGFTIGVLIGNANNSYTNYLFAVSSGMYLYVFLGTLIPEIRDSVNEQIKVDMMGSIRSTVLQAAGIIIGLLFMFFMCKYGRDIQIL